MQTKIVTVSVTERLSTVEDIMTLGRVRHMPVVHGGKLVGVLSHRDLLRASLSELGSFGSETRRGLPARDRDRPGDVGPADHDRTGSFRATRRAT